MIELQSSAIRLLIDPEKGGMITSVTTPDDLENWLFYDPSKAAGPGKNPLNYDDVWIGGFEELFPNDAPGEFMGRQFPDHGELWNNPVEIVEKTDNSISMVRRIKSVPAIYKKRISILSDGTGFVNDYEIQNTGADDLVYLLKLHPAMRLEPGDRLMMPDCKVVPVSLDFSSKIKEQGPFNWPLVNSGKNEQDISVIHSKESRLQEFIYCYELSSGNCGYFRKRTGKTLSIHFDPEDFPYCWFFMTFGGWNDYYTVVMEPCTNMPKDLKTAHSLNQSARLQPGESKKYRVRVTIH